MKSFIQNVPYSPWHSEQSHNKSSIFIAQEKKIQKQILFRQDFFLLMRISNENILSFFFSFSNTVTSSNCLFLFFQFSNTVNFDQKHSLTYTYEDKLSVNLFLLVIIYITLLKHSQSKSIFFEVEIEILGSFFFLVHHFYVAHS